MSTFSTQTFLQQLPGHLQGRIKTVFLKQNLPSTQQFLMEHLQQQPLQHWYQSSVCIAATQTQGIGRQGRSWHSPEGENVYLSLATLVPPNQLKPLLSPAIGIELARQLNHLLLTNKKTNDKPDTLLNPSLGPSLIKVKWPNDLVIATNNAPATKKLGGILINTVARPASKSNAFTTAGHLLIIGVGINVSFCQEQLRRLDQPGISLRQLNRGLYSRLEISALVCNSLLTVLEHLHQDTLSSYVEQWPEYDALIRQPVSLHRDNQIVYTGMNKGITTQGELLLADDLNPDELTRHCIGELSLRIKADTKQGNSSRPTTPVPA